MPASIIGTGRTARWHTSHAWRYAGLGLANRPERSQGEAVAHEGSHEGLLVETTRDEQDLLGQATDVFEPLFLHGRTDRCLEPSEVGLARVD